MTIFSKKPLVIVHSGNFHADDVFAVATVSLFLNKKIKIIRTRDFEIIKKGDYVIDVGGKYDEAENLFDHHQTKTLINADIENADKRGLKIWVEGAGKRLNGVPYASFGLVWKKFGEKICGSKSTAEKIDEELVQAIDAIDNGVGEIKPIFENVYTTNISDLVRIMNPSWKEGGRKTDEYFLEAVLFAEKIILREIKCFSDLEEGSKKALEVYEKSKDKKIIIFDEVLPWREVLNKFKEPVFVVEPEEEGRETGWKVKTVKDNLGGFVNRKDLPEEWAGKTGKELAEISGVPDAVFCHNKRFIAGASSKAGAIALAQKALLKS